MRPAGSNAPGPASPQASAEAVVPPSTVARGAEGHVPPASPDIPAAAAPAPAATSGEAVEVVVDDGVPGSPRVLDALDAALAAGRACAVVDGSWPAATLAAVRAAIDAGAAAGRVHPGDLVVFSSGSTGRPRGIVRDPRSWAISVADAAALFDLHPGDAVAVPGPLASTLYLFGAWHARRVGARVLTGEGPREATHVHLVPARLPALLADVAAGRYPRLRTLVVAGDALAPDPAARVVAAGLRLVTYYGAAELSFVGARVRGGGVGEGVVGVGGDVEAVGDGAGVLRPFPGVEVRVRAGELWSRSPYAARGYLDPAAGGPWRRDAEGWSSVGDLGRWHETGDAAGGFEVLGRGAAAVVTGGHTVVAEDVEARLRALPGVGDAAVVGLPHPRLGQRLVALVEPMPGAANAHAGGERAGDAAPSAALVASLRAAVASWPAPSRPRGWVVGGVPRNAPGKIDRGRARDLVERGLA